MKSLIVGVTGQDGSLLADHLLSLGHEVHGTFRRGSSDKFWRLNEMQNYEKIKLHPYNIGSEIGFADLLVRIKPDHIYSLAGESFTQLSFDEPKHYMDINIGGTVEQLEAIRNYAPESKALFACSSEVFGGVRDASFADENTNMFPANPYGISKLTQRHLVNLYREKYKLMCFTGILFPHESPYRSNEFVTRKITRGLVQTIYADANPMILGDISMSRDWGSAFDYVGWMAKLIDTSDVGDFVFSTGQNTSVEEFLLLCLSALEIEFTRVADEVTGVVTYENNRTGKTLIKSDPTRFSANRFTYPPGSSSKLFSVIGTQRFTTLTEIASQMIAKDKEWL